MKTDSPDSRSQEIELKLALTARDGADLARLLGRTPLLRRHQATVLQLHNVYYDTPDQLLRRQRIALRLRRVGDGAAAQWLQTLKVGAQGDSALSQRGEWEKPVDGAALSKQALDATPWASIDPDGAIFASLGPCFVTQFERTQWLLRRPGGSVVEVALDQGRVLAGGGSAVICELELELKAGHAGLLFDLAEKIAASVAVLPLHLSKAQRGFALAQDALYAPLYAQPPLLEKDLPLPQAATGVLREMFCQFSANLVALRACDDPELVHQARVGWRRFRSALRLFGPVVAPPPNRSALQPLLVALGAVRDLDVAHSETLPALSNAFVAGDPVRERAWQKAYQLLTRATAARREQLLQALGVPALGVALLGITRWLEGLGAQGLQREHSARDESLSHWSRRRVARLHGRLALALKHCETPAGQHRARILAKRLRYGIEALRPLLRAKRSRRWLRQATDLQAGMGERRDILQAAIVLAKLHADHGLTEFLRGVAAGRG